MEYMVSPLTVSWEKEDGIMLFSVLTSWTAHFSPWLQFISYKIEISLCTFHFFLWVWWRKFKLSVWLCIYSSKGRRHELKKHEDLQITSEHRYSMRKNMNLPGSSWRSNESREVAFSISVFIQLCLQASGRTRKKQKCQNIMRKAALAKFLAWPV